MHFRVLNSPEHAYTFEATFDPNHRLAPALFSQKPPMHFHPHQEENIKVLAGKLAVDVEGVTHLLSPADDTLSIRPWTRHCMYPAPAKEGAPPSTDKITVLLRGQKTPEPFGEDILFFGELVSLPGCCCSEWERH